MKLALFAITAALASAQEYRVSVPAGIERIEWSSPGIGWDVDVAYDPDTCEISCTYRRTHDVLGAMPLLPPVTTVRLYDGPLEPAVAVIDPAGLSSPALQERPAPDDAGACIASKRLPFTPSQATITTAEQATHRTIVHRASRPVIPTLTLRI